jgi:membrane fusion protein, heavy metal efflux system
MQISWREEARHQVRRTRRASILIAILFLLSAACTPNPRAADEVKTDKHPEPEPIPGRVTFAADSPKLSQIHSELVQTASIPVNEVNSPGKVEANQNRLAHVVAPLAGRVSQVLVRIGDFVQQGQPVLIMESPDLDTAIAAQTQAEAGVNQAKIALTKAKSDLERTKLLFDDGAVPQKDLIAAQSVVALSEPALKQAEAASSQALRKLELLGVQPGAVGQKLTVKAPISGKVLEISVSGSEIKNDTTASLMTIADLSTIWVSSDVQEANIGLARVGQRVEIEMPAYPNEKFTGRVFQIADTEDPTTRTIKVRTEMANPNGRFRPEMYAQIRLIGEAKTMPVVPAAAIVQSEGRSVVFRQVSAGVFDLVAVKTGLNVSGKIAITNGISAGDRIVTDGTMLLQANNN